MHERIPVCGIFVNSLEEPEANGAEIMLRTESRLLALAMVFTGHEIRNTKTICEKMFQVCTTKDASELVGPCRFRT